MPPFFPRAPTKVKRRPAARAGCLWNRRRHKKPGSYAGLFGAFTEPTDSLAAASAEAKAVAVSAEEQQKDDDPAAVVIVVTAVVAAASAKTVAANG